MPSARVNGQTLWYDDTGGDGPAVIFSHGFLMDREMFAANVAALVPAADIAYLGFAYQDQAEAMRVFQGPLGAYIRSLVEAKGLQLMRVPWDVGMQEMGIGASWRHLSVVGSYS